MLGDLISAYRERHPDLPVPPLELARVAPPPRPDVRRCPSCGSAMRQTNYAYNSNVYIDRCDPCGRVWLDRHELIKLARHVTGHPKLNRLGESVAEAMVDSDKQQERLNSLPFLPSMLFGTPIPITASAPRPSSMSAAGLPPNCSQFC